MRLKPGDKVVFKNYDNALNDYLRDFPEPSYNIGSPNDHICGILKSDYVSQLEGKSFKVEFVGPDNKSFAIENIDYVFWKSFVYKSIGLDIQIFDDDMFDI